MKSADENGGRRPPRVFLTNRSAGKGDFDRASHFSGSSGRPLESHHALEVFRLREEVEGLDGGEGVGVSFEKCGEIPHLGGGIAGNVNDGARPESEELVEEPAPAPSTTSTTGVVEQTITVNTAAPGGNASLLTLEPS